MRKEMTWGCESRNTLHNVLKLEGRVDGERVFSP